MKTIICFVTIFALGFANEIKMYNNCPFNVWPGIQENAGHGQPEGGGFGRGTYQAKSVYVEGNWARTSCDDGGHFQTGDCGNRIQCNGAGGVPPVSVAEITLAGADGLDFYDVSLVDGYNLPIRMTPTGGYDLRDDGKYDCKSPGWFADLNAICIGELAIKAGEWAVACLSALMRFNTDQYCCRGAFGTPQTCKSYNWPVNYPSIFKQACPDAYNYPYDDTTSTFTCKGNPATNYEVVFCP